MQSATTEPLSPRRELISQEQRVSPVRGLVPFQNVRGKPYDVLHLKRWIRLNRLIYKTDKIDALAAARTMVFLPEVLDYAALLDVRLSLRTDCSSAPGDLGALREAGLYDVFLCPPAVDALHLESWLETCHRVGLPVRLQLQAPFDPALDVEALAERVATAGVVVTNVTLYDPFLELHPSRHANYSRTTVDHMSALVEALEGRGVEANLLHLPFCVIKKENWVRVANTAQFFLDHQQYHKHSYELATKLYRRGPVIAGKAVLMRLARYRLYRHQIDEKVIPWLQEHPWFYARVRIWQKLTRHLRVLRGVPRKAEDPMGAYRREVEKRRNQERRTLGPKCSQCSLRRICDHDTQAFRRRLPGLSVTAQEGEMVVSSQHFCAEQPKYYDSVDIDRCGFREGYLELAKQANDVIINRAPDQQLMSYDYGVEGGLFDRMEGGLRWYSFTNTEKESWPLARLAPPFTMSVVVAGGIADYIGFSFGRHCKLVCPMESYQHQIVLHVAADGHYVLLRDGRLVQPVEFEGAHYVPLRLGSYLEPRISIWNIEENIVTQTVKIWEKDEPAPAARRPAKYSVLIVCTRYTRRLQAALLTIAHQTDIDLAKIEVIITYVPGIDSTDDLIDSIQFAYPDLRILRSPFPERNANSKGFMINESVRMASGQWIVLMDADILLPPNMFAKIDELENPGYFVAPDGRKMLSRETTAKILLGEIEPWDSWYELLNAPGEYRRREAKGVPIGFCQCVRAECFDKVKYREYEHFEFGDMDFGNEIRENFGRETRLSGVVVLHMDHGGSQWYGTQQHF